MVLFRKILRPCLLGFKYSLLFQHSVHFFSQCILTEIREENSDFSDVNADLSMEYEDSQEYDESSGSGNKLWYV